LRAFASYYLITRRNLSPRINPIVNVRSHRCKPLLYRPAMPWQCSVCRLLLWEGD